MVRGATMLTFSGEIYNYRSLRSALVKHGHDFETASDTEVLLNAYRQWGDACLSKLDGMFAFAIWDNEARRLVLARDRLGVKPLYWARTGSGLVFASEPKGLFRHPDVKPSVSAEGLAMLFATFGTHHPGATPYASVAEVVPGTFLVAEDNAIRTGTYWQLEARPHGEDYHDTIESTAKLLEAAVAQQLESDVSMCSLLSGGLDSSLVTMHANRHLPDLETYAVGFVGEADDFVPDLMRPTLDRPYAESVSRHLELKHTYLALEAEQLQEAQAAATAARDLPSLGNLDASLHLLFRSIAEQATVALSGEAADEVFGGYPWFHDPAALDRRGFPWAPPGAGLAEVLKPSVKDRMNATGYVNAAYDKAVAETPVLDGESPSDRRRREISYLALTRFLPVLLDRKDRMSMACGLEVRVPYCDHRLVEYVFNVPWEMKAFGGRPKSLLREVGYGDLPDDVCARAKSAYPVASDPIYEDRLRDQVSSVMDRDDSLLAQIVHPPAVERLIERTSDKPIWLQNLALGYLDQVERWAQHVQLDSIEL